MKSVTYILKHDSFKTHVKESSFNYGTLLKENSIVDSDLFHYYEIISKQKNPNAEIPLIFIRVETF